MNDYLVWWIDQRCCEAIGTDLPEFVPIYIRGQYQQRYGRPGRGRLWVAHNFPDGIQIKPWPDTPLGRYLGGDFGGLVIFQDDAEILRDFPGIITNLKLERLIVPSEPVDMMMALARLRICEEEKRLPK